MCDCAFVRAVIYASLDFSRRTAAVAAVMRMAAGAQSGFKAF